MAANIMRLFLLFLLFLININSQAFDFIGDISARDISSDNYIISATYPESNNRVYLNWKISEGSYLYKDKIGVKSMLMITLWTLLLSTLLAFLAPFLTNFNHFITQSITSIKYPQFFRSKM